MNGNRGVEELPVARALAGVIAGPAVRAGQRVLLHVLLPGLLVAPRLREVEPCLDVLARRARVVARRQQADEKRPLPALGVRALGDRRFIDRRQVLRDEAHCLRTCGARGNGAPRRHGMTDIVRTPWAPWISTP